MKKDLTLLEYQAKILQMTFKTGQRIEVIYDQKEI